MIGLFNNYYAKTLEIKLNSIHVYYYLLTKLKYFSRISLFYNKKITLKCFQLNKKQKIYYLDSLENKVSF